MLKAVFFDLDGTLLPLDENEFVKAYFELLANYMKPYGYSTSQIFEIINEGVKAMYQNNGRKLNEEVFWDRFYELTPIKNLDFKKIFDDFYNKEFLTTIEYTSPNPLALSIINEIKSLGLKVMLTTNPIFPLVATKNRMGFIDLIPQDFDYVTTYENSSYTKPNPLYFKQVMDKFNLKSDEVILFGNNTKEDGDTARALGIKCYLVTGHIIYKDESKWNYKEIKMNQIIDIIKSNLD